MAAHIDFAAVKIAVSIEQAIQHLGLKMKKEGDQYRSPCPACAKGGDRALVATPAKGFYCFGGKKGGDVIAMVAHVRGCSQRDAAIELQEAFGINSDDAPAQPAKRAEVAKEAPTEALQPLDHLTTDHPAIEALGLTATACEALGIGYTGKGLMRGRIALPLRLPDGTLVGYMGIATAADQAPLLLFPKNLDERCQAPPQPVEQPKPAADELRKLFRVVA